MFYERNGFYFIVDAVVVTTTAGVLPSLIIIIIKWHRRDECHPVEYLRAAAYSLIVSVNVVSGSDALSYRGNSLTTPFFLFSSIARAFVVYLLAANIYPQNSQRQQQRKTVIKWYIHRMCIADANSAPSREQWKRKKEKKRKRKEYQNTNNKNNKIP